MDAQVVAAAMVVGALVLSCVCCQLFSVHAEDASGPEKDFGRGARLRQRSSSAATTRLSSGSQRPAIVQDGTGFLRSPWRAGPAAAEAVEPDSYLQFDVAPSPVPILNGELAPALAQQGSNVKDGPGLYIITHSQTGVTSGMSISTGVTTFLVTGAVVNVLETSSSPAEMRVRGRVERPAGWISLVDTTDGYRWAERLEAPSQPGLSASTPNRVQDIVRIRMTELSDDGGLGCSLSPDLTVVAVVQAVAKQFGWRRGDKVLAINGFQVSTKYDFIGELQKAVLLHTDTGKPVVFDIARQSAPGVAGAEEEIHAERAMPSSLMSPSMVSDIMSQQGSRTLHTIPPGSSPVTPGQVAAPAGVHEHRLASAPFGSAAPLAIAAAPAVVMTAPPAISYPRPVPSSLVPSGVLAAPQTVATAAYAPVPAQALPVGAAAPLAPPTLAPPTLAPAVHVSRRPAARAVAMPNWGTM